ncbi:nefa-interacting nuclear protein nip30 [Holotrichia oblita]|uniref:Nefa-interacting nuclear protein nip30 n=1 Tax=Holotrichia oblita TaxID=644536 RepID=A0ACB9TJU3_HOLOL|nr:nefa-interacting nuclear protein nip30 [Holotrichia oblita]
MSSGFITESEALEVRRKKQEEWEKVRKADDPLERPEETYDHRSLYERLQEQKQKRDLEYEEAHKLKNMIKGLDDDEIEFLDLVDRTKLAADRKKTIEEEIELNDYRNRVASLQEKNLDQKLQLEINTLKPKLISNNRMSQTKLLKGVVVKKTGGRKRKSSEMEDKDDMNDKTKEAGENCPLNVGDSNISSAVDNGEKINNTTGKGDSDTSKKDGKVSNAGLTCIGILPGLGCYDDSSSEASSDSDQEEEEIADKSNQKVQIDLLGRKIIRKES